jgi:membrane protein implicated in regulation of membrane protease activity
LVHRRDTIADVAVLLWLLAGVALAIAEAFTLTFVLMMFAAGAFAAGAAAALGAPVAAQGGVFALVSVLSLVAVRPALRRHMERRSSDGPIGMEAIESASAVVLERVDADRGLVKIDGELWQARALDAAQVIEPGERVRVVEVKGVTAMVWKD